MSNAELTTVLQQVTAQMAADHVWFGGVHEDITDHATRLDKLTLVTTTNQVELQISTAESKKAFALIDVNDGAIKSVVQQVTDKTTEHDRLLQQVDTALRAQVQAEVSRLDALVAELQANTAEGGHAQALAGLRNLQEEVRSLTANTSGHLSDLKGVVGGLQTAGADFTNHTRGFEAALVQRVEQLAQAQQAQAATGASRSRTGLRVPHGTTRASTGRRRRTRQSTNPEQRWRSCLPSRARPPYGFPAGGPSSSSGYGSSLWTPWGEWLPEWPYLPTNAAAPQHVTRTRGQLSS